MPVYTDQLNRQIQLPQTPVRIVSLVPSQTEFLFQLGLELEVVGITKFCTRPARWLQTKISIGGTKNINLEKIKALKPDLIIANKEENLEEQVLALEKTTPVWISDVRNTDNALQMMESIGQITGKEQKAIEIVYQIKNHLSTIQTSIALAQPIQTAYLIWKNPYMSIGGDTFIHGMLQMAGLHNVFSESLRYPETTLEAISAKQADLVLLSSEPYPFREKHIEEVQRQLPNARIMLVNGEMFSWYGSRMLYLKDYLNVFLSKIHTKP